MICKNCGKEFEGKFCPECGAQVDDELTQCPVCGTERIGGGKFCVNCGYNYDSLKSGQEVNPTNTNTSNKFDAKKFLGIFAKIYRWLLAGGMLFVGIVSLLCLTAPTITEEFFGEVNKLCTGFQAIGGKNVDVPDSVVNAGVTLLTLSLIAMVYGGVQLYFAFKKPYSNAVGKKKFVLWGIDGIISLILIILGGVVYTAAKSDEFMDGKLGSGFAMCIVMGVFGLLFLGARIFYEFKVFKWEDTGLTEEQIAKAKERKHIDKAKVKKIAKTVGIPVIIIAVLLAVIVPTVAWANNIFRVGKVDKINIGDTQEQVVEILGEPYEKSDYRYEYYSKDYVKVSEQIKKLSGSKSLTANMSKDDEWDFDLDDDIDLDKEIGGSSSKLDKLYKQLNEMNYEYIRVDFDGDKKVTEVFFDNDKCDSRNAEENKKEVKSYELNGNTTLQQYDILNLFYSITFTDGSSLKSLIINEVFSDISKDKIEWEDIYGNEYNVQLKVTPITKLTSDIVKILAGGDKSTLTEFEIASNITSIDYGAIS